MNRTQTITRSVVAGAAIAVAALTLAGCATPPPPRPVPPPPQAVASPPATEVYAYPLHGQPPAQQDRDRYECSQWATQQTGFNPSAPGIPPQQQVRVVTGPPPGSGTAAGVVTGAILGAAIGGPWRGPGPALAGAVVGGAIGTAAEQNARQTQTYTVTDPRALAQMQQQAANYRRALGACMDARGYAVR